MKNKCVSLLFLLFSFLSIGAYAQVKVEGNVFDETDSPLIGVSVFTEGRKTGTVTNADGHFTIMVPDANSHLTFSYVGYMTQKIQLKGKRILKVVMKEDAELLDEVVVVGYGTTKRKNFTGSVSTVKASETPLALMPTSNAMDILRGTATGITVSQQQGAGQAPSLQVRGQKSVNGGSTPLIVMDGVIYMGSFRDIDPTTIESMSILKDATSLAAYGSQAANGVIMITTKKGKLGKPVINVNTS